jgi:acetyl-CoA carboxylase carboxyl transferase alpha subunit/acetyl-CoA carboxylase carboxyl transferase beta subunit
MTSIAGTSATGPRPVDDAEWTVCRDCRAVLYAKRLARNLGVCPECGRHNALTAAERLELLLDRGSVQPLPLPLTAADPLGFVDSRPYPERLQRAREATGLAEAVVCVRGEILGQPVVVAVLDFRFLGGSLSGAVGELITGAAETALVDRTPLLLVSASGGARMQEGAVSLMQMAKTCQALAALNEAGVLTVSLVTDPTFGGVAASFATACDVIIAEPGARLGFAGPRVIEQTIRQKLPDGFQTAEFLAARGLIDMIRPRAALRVTLARLLSFGAGRPADDSEPADAGSPAVTDPELLPVRSPWELVQRARHLDRPTTLDYLNRIVSDFEELRGDRLGGDCPAIVAGVGRLDGLAVMLVGHQRGHTTADLVARNFGMPNPPGYRKAARLMRLAAKLRVPVVTLIDTPGAYPGLQAEEQGQAMAIAQNLVLMSGLPVPVVAVVIGEGGSGGALALAVADRVYMCAGSIYSVISPEGCASILWKDPALAPRAAEALKLDARSLLRLGVVDGVVPEPAGGAHLAHAEAADALRRVLVAALRDLLPLDPASLVARRRRRFRAFGAGAAPVGGSAGREGEGP